jgi:hypothetical protein
MSTAKDPIDALKKGGVSVDAISKVQGYLDNPLAAAFMAKVGLNKGQTAEMLSQLKSGLQGQDSSPSRVSGDELSVYRDALKQIK